MENTESWLAKLFAAIDSKSVAEFSTMLDADVEFRFANAPVIYGREASSEYVGQFFAAIDQVSHRLEHTIRQGDWLICQGEVSYTRLDKTILTVPFCNWFELQNDKAKRYWIYVDASALFTAAQA